MLWYPHRDYTVPKVASIQRGYAAMGQPMRFRLCLALNINVRTLGLPGGGRHVANGMTRRGGWSGMGGLLCLRRWPYANLEQEGMDDGLCLGGCQRLPIKKGYKRCMPVSKNYFIVERNDMEKIPQNFAVWDRRVDSWDLLNSARLARVCQRYGRSYALTRRIASTNGYHAQTPTPGTSLHPAPRQDEPQGERS